ncbi:hypothetical protein Tco_1472185, partial [Tanacetum coccineum]
LIEQVIDPGKRVAVLDSQLVQFLIISTHTERTIFLLNKQHWTSPRCQKIRWFSNRHSSKNKIYAKFYFARWG